MAPGTAPRPYRDFLTPSLHRRFTEASVYTFGLCYVIAVWMGDWSHYLWFWFPIGPVGARALLLYIPALLVYVLRVAQWHVGQRNTTHPSATFSRFIWRKQTLGTFAIYILSAWFYGEVYIWSRSEQGRLTFKLPALHASKDRLNERPVYLRFLFFSVAVVQATIHLWADYDVIAIPTKANQLSQTDSGRQLVRRLMDMANVAALTSVSAFVLGTVAYFLGLRYVIWEWYFSFFKYFVNVHVRHAKPTGLPPFINLVLMFAAEGTLVALLWQFSNKTFDLLISQEPLKKDKPITSESKDPNGSLLNGLKAKKGEVRSIAFWELAIITDRFADRRKTIYGELDRAKGATYKQVAGICLAELRAIVERVGIATDPKYRPVEPNKKIAPAKIELVPQIASPLKDAQIAGPGVPPVTRWEKIESVTGHIARTYSSPQNVQNSYAKEYLNKGQAKGTESVRQAETAWGTYRDKLISSPIGWIFRQSLYRTAVTVITGAPYSRQSAILNAIITLTNLTVNSLKEDEFGMFQKEVPEIVRVFTTTIKAIESYVQGLQVHWTDIETLAKPESERKKVKEVEDVVAALKEGLQKILGSFNEYLLAMDMTKVEVQDAKKLVARDTPEVLQIGGMI